jgi:septal ring factor EnvC (AmiA/AmiB activator)
MRKTSFIIILFFLFVFTGTNLAGDDVAINAEQFKTQKKQLQEIQQELKQKKAGEKAVLRREESIVGALSRIERGLLRREKELVRLDSRHHRIQKKTDAIQKKLNRIQREIDQNQTRLHSRIAAMYKTGRTGYLPYLLSSDSYNDFMRMTKFLKIVIDHDANLLSNYRAQWLEKRRYQEKLEKDIKELKRVIADQERKKVEILNAKKEKRAFLHVVRRQKAEYQKWIMELEGRARELQLLIEKLETEMRESEVTGLNFGYHKGRLSLPVRGNITPEKRGRAIIIEAPEDSPIRAVFSGKVIYSGWFDGYGNIIILDHGDKYYSVSGYASKVLKKVNERVAAGEVIALVGDTCSITGPCLYFEIRHEGKPEDPLEWLFMPKGSNGRSEAKKGSAVSEGGGSS